MCTASPLPQVYSPNPSFFQNKGGQCRYTHIGKGCAPQVVIQLAVETAHDHPISAARKLLSQSPTDLRIEQKKRLYHLLENCADFLRRSYPQYILPNWMKLSMTEVRSVCLAKPNGDFRPIEVRKSALQNWDHSLTEHGLTGQDIAPHNHTVKKNGLGYLIMATQALASRGYVVHSAVG